MRKEAELNLVIAIDSSYSMMARDAEASRFALAVRCANNVLQALLLEGKHPFVSVLAYNDGLMEVAGPVRLSKEAASAVRRSLSSVEPRGKASLSSLLEEAAKLASQADGAKKGRCAIVLFTDGIYSDLNRVIERAPKILSGMQLFPVMVGSALGGAPQMERLAKAACGVVLHTGTESFTDEFLGTVGACGGSGSRRRGLKAGDFVLDRISTALARVGPSCGADCLRIKADLFDGSAQCDTAFVDCPVCGRGFGVPAAWLDAECPSCLAPLALHEDNERIEVGETLCPSCNNAFRILADAVRAPCPKCGAKLSFEENEV
ncbi:MAG: hypothetical protein CVT48_03980 [Thermoplasmata archaeon HGW-Thermoplasmata-1]|nr:MAG: hypothetical protein CVT48_03980 [Thermoplasmata archaeon HGW-Thermoplasmata-1]